MNIMEYQNDMSLHFPLADEVENIKESKFDEDEITIMNDFNKKSKKARKEIYGKGIEAKAIKEELGDFDVFHSIAYQQIIKKFGKSIRLTELLGIINSIQIYLQIKKNSMLPQISRNEKRSFPLLIKYIERNSYLIFPHLQYIFLCNSSFKKIPLDTT